MGDDMVGDWAMGVNLFLGTKYLEIKVEIIWVSGGKYWKEKQRVLENRVLLSNGDSAKFRSSYQMAIANVSFLRLNWVINGI